MEVLIKLRERARNLAKAQTERIRKLTDGQTMTEYALILAAVAIVVYASYLLMGQDIECLVNKIDTALTNAS